MRRSTRAVVLVGAALLSTLAACSDGDGHGDGRAGEDAAVVEGDDPTGTTSGGAPAEDLCGPSVATSSERAPVTTALAGSFADVVPVPLEVTPVDGRLSVGARGVIAVTTPDAEVAACLLRDELVRLVGVELDVLVAESGEVGSAGEAAVIAFESESDGQPGSPSVSAAEGYRIDSTAEGITIRAPAAAGHGWAVQTLLQAVAPEAEVSGGQGSLSFPLGTVVDAPRFEWRGVMIDIARHFFGLDDLTGVVDLLASYKLDVLHLHLSDDQGWRIAIDAYPALTAVGGASEVGGGAGGFLTREDYETLVAYASRRGVTVVPEIDMPGHTNAALLAVPELNCDGVPPEPYTGTSVGFSSLCIGDPDVDEFVRTVLAEVAALTPGPYIHIGGDEAHSTTAADYEAFMTDTLAVVEELGKVPVGWEEIGSVDHSGEVVAQHWLDSATAEEAAGSGASIVLSPSSVLYFDMAYGPFAPDGNSWAGTTDTREVYDWEPTAALDVDASAILGVEAPLWTELVESPEEIQLRLLPRLPALAEVAWSAPQTRGWESFKARLSSHLHRWSATGVSFVDDPGLH